MTLTNATMSNDSIFGYNERAGGQTQSVPARNVSSIDVRRHNAVLSTAVAIAAATAAYLAYKKLWESALVRPRD